MRNLVNVVHPHTYKLEGNIGNLKLIVGPSEVNKKRDEMVAFFLEKVKENDSRILVYFERSGTQIDMGMKYLSLKYDPKYESLTNVNKIFYTPNSGLPIKDEQPKEMNDKIWKYIQENFISASKLKEISAGFENIFFIGGVLENCLGNFAHYFSANYSSGEKLFCIEDLCVSFDEKKVEKIKDALLNDRINFINHEEAIELICKFSHKKLYRSNQRFSR